MNEIACIGGMSIQDRNKKIGSRILYRNKHYSIVIMYTTLTFCTLFNRQVFLNKSFITKWLVVAEVMACYEIKLSSRDVTSVA